MSVKKTLKDLKVAAIIDPSSSQHTNVFSRLANGQVVVYTTLKSKNRRTEILFAAGKVVVHVNRGGGIGMFALAGRFNLIEIYKSGSQHPIATIDITIDPHTSSFNPVYIFKHNSTELGEGYGQHIDLLIADSILRTQLSHSGDYVEAGVLNFIKSQFAT